MVDRIAGLILAAGDADRARKMGAEGVGLCRTEHMFLGSRRPLLERVILADNVKERDAALATRNPSTSSTAPTWTTSHARRSGSRWRG